MKKIIFVLLISGLMSLHATAQIKLGLATGISPSHIDLGEVIQNTPDNQFRISVTSATPPWMIGPFMRIQAKSLYLQTGLYAGSGKVYYDVDNLNSNETVLSQTWDREYSFDFPLELGFMFESGLSFNAGIIGTNYLQVEKETFFPAFKTMMTDMIKDKRYGYKFGIQFDIDDQISLSASYVNYKDVKNTIVVKDNVGYDFFVKRNYITVNFYWNFIPE